MADSKFVDNVIQCIRDRRALIAVSSMNRLLGSMKIRIFNQGRATDGGLIGPYISAWKNVRAKAGRQTAYKDLEFSSDLRNSIQVGTSSGEVVIGFLVDKSRLIASGQEQQTGKEIFTPTQEEIDLTVESVLDLVDECLDQAVRI